MQQSMARTTEYILNHSAAALVRPRVGVPALLFLILLIIGLLGTAAGRRSVVRGELI